MTHPWHDVIPGQRLPLEFTTVIEIPMGSSELPTHRLSMLKRFFQDYKMLEGKAVNVDDMEPFEMALPIIRDALERYSTARRRGFVLDK